MISTKNASTQEIRFQGLSLSPGLAQGIARRISAIDLDALVSYKYQVQDVAAEKERLHNAAKRSREQIALLRTSMSGEISEIFEVQLCMIDDSNEIPQVADRIVSQKLNAEFVLAQRLLELRGSFESLSDGLFRARAMDIQDVFHRILANLIEIDHVRTNALNEVPPGTILVSERLLPSDIIHLNTANIAAIVTEAGSPVSHAAILCRELKIPYVAGIKGIATLIRSKNRVFVNGDAGWIALHPAERTCILLAEENMIVSNSIASDRNCRTRDGTRIELLANASSADDVTTALNRGAEGIGLFRTEFYFLQKTTRPSEDEEIEFYKDVISRAKAFRVCFRVYDFGGDKIPLFPLPEGLSRTSFGCRGIRYLLANEGLFRRQLSCIAKATGTAQFDILFPFVTVADELDSAVQIATAEMEKYSIARTAYRIGMMLEVPSAFFDLPAMLAAVDFISVGTNDLVQYLFAYDREESGQASLYRHARRTICSLVEKIMGMNRPGKAVTVCGEMAGDPEVIPCLLRAGICSLSLSSANIAKAYSCISEIDLREPSK